MRPSRDEASPAEPREGTAQSGQAKRRRILEEVARFGRYRIADVGEPHPMTGAPPTSEFLAAGIGAEAAAPAAPVTVSRPS